MKSKFFSVIIIILIFVTIGFIILGRRLLTIDFVNSLPIQIEFIFLFFLIILIILFILINFSKINKIKNKDKKVDKKILKEEKRKLFLEKKDKIKLQREDKNKQGNNNSKNNIQELVDKKTNLKKESEEIVQTLKEAEKQFLKNKIDKDTFDKISKENNAKLIKIESEIDAKNIALNPKDTKNIEQVSNDKKAVLKELFEQRQKKVLELQLTEKSFYKRKIDENAFKKINSEIRTEIVSIDGKINAIQKADAVEKIKKQLIEGAKEVNKQKKNTQKRKTENEIREEEIFAQIDDLVGGLK